MEYAKTNLPMLLSIRSIITMSTVDYSKIVSKGGEKHDFYEVNYVQSGVCKMKLNGVLHTFTEGQMILYAPNTHHASDPCNSISNIISFESDWYGFASMQDRVITLTPRQRQTITQIVDTYNDSFRLLPDGGDIIGMIARDDVDVLKLQKMKNQLELLFLDIYQADKKGISNHKIHSNEQFELAVQYMRSNLAKNPSLEDIAKHCHVSVSRLKLIFKEQCDCSPISYLIKMKLDEAKLLMTETSMNFTQISDSLGFTSVHYFSKLFKKKTGLTPSEYLRSIEKKERIGNDT